MVLVPCGTMVDITTTFHADHALGELHDLCKG